MRKLASVQKIEEVKSIPGADSICAYRVNDWWVVDTIGKYDVGSVVVYLEVDAWIPHKLAPFLSKGQYPRVYNGVEGERLKTVKLRGQISQGLLLQIDSIPLHVYASVNDETGEPYRLMDLELLVGEDLTMELGIQKWEPNIPACLSGMMKGQFPSYIPKTDQERCQNLRKEIFEEHKDETYEVTIKLDGSSMTVFIDNEGELCVCSRNINLKETEDNSFWKAAREQKLDAYLSHQYTNFGRQYAVQGELIGEGIQGNPEKIQGQKFYVFDVYSINDGVYLDPPTRRAFVSEMEFAGSSVEHVPFLSSRFSVGELDELTIDALLKMAEGPSMNPKTSREGLVFKSNESDFSFKAISNSWLLVNQ